MLYGNQLLKFEFLSIIFSICGIYKSNKDYRLNGTHRKVIRNINESKAYNTISG